MTESRRTAPPLEAGEDIATPSAVSRQPGESPSGVGVYDRPLQTRGAGGIGIGTIVTILLLLILAYFVFQWLT